MKKIFFIFVLVFCLTAGFAQSTNYTSEDLLNYLQNAPGSHLPKEDQYVEVESGFFSVEAASIDGLGVDYLVKFIGSKYQSMSFSKLIYIYSETITTRVIPGFGYEPDVITIDNYLKLKYTGFTAPAIASDGNRIDVPIFITEKL